jgi:hypothetical protein
MFFWGGNPGSGGYFAAVPSGTFADAPGESTNDDVEHVERASHPNSVHVFGKPFGASSPAVSQSTPTKGVTLTKSRIAIAAALLAVAAIAAGSALAGTAVSTKIVPFTATYTGLANVIVDETAGISTITAAGAGKGTPIGASKLTGKGTGSADQNAACQPFNGTGQLVGLKGAKINFKMAAAQGCGGPDDFSITGRAIVTGGAGKYKKAKGNIKVVGTWKRSTKAFTIKFIGKLTV